MLVTLSKLPFEPAELEPHISARTFEFHHGKHHQAYVDNTNKLIAGTELEKADLVTIIKSASASPASSGLFNNAAQVYNHAFYWECLRPGGGGRPYGKIAGMIETDLGGYDQFAAEFKNAGITQFGSGWAWLVLDNGKLRIVKTANADTPLVHGLKPLLTVDVWEHAYYLDYQNRRPDYLQVFIDKLINWDFVNGNLG